MRKATACKQCRETKRRCTGRAGVSECIQCKHRKIGCSLNETYTRRHHRARDELSQTGRQPTGSSQERTQLSDILNHEEATYLVGMYIDLVHDRPHSLFHVPTLWQEIESGAIHPPLMTSLCAFGARVSTRADLRDKVTQLMTLTKQSLHKTLEDICLATVQTCILLANLCAADLEPTLEALYFGIATRIATILKLNKVDATDDILTRETKCRVWWALVMADHWCSAGLHLAQQLDRPYDSMPYPIDEVQFQEVLTPQDLARQTEPGIWGYMIQLVRLFRPICELNGRLADVKGSYEQDIDRVLQLERSLDDWTSELPDSMTDNPSNLEAHRARGTGGCFVALHLGYYHYSSLLLFRFLSRGRSDQEPRLADKCRANARQFSRLLQHARARPGCEAIYATVGHMAMVSSSVLLHSLLFGDKEQLADTKANLVANFEALMELQLYWPCLKLTMHRLQLFQRFCLQTGSRDTYRVDEWMLTFLMHHALPLDERFVPLDPALSAVDSIPTRDYANTVPELEFSPGRESAVQGAFAPLWELGGL